MKNQLFARKSIERLLGDSQRPDQRLAKTLGPWSLTALGIGAVVGSGIFTSVGSAIAGQKFDTTSILNVPLLDYLIHHNASFGRPGAGPAIAVSMVLVGVVCAFTALRPRSFRAPGGVVTPLLSIAFCLLLMAGLPVLTWIRFVAWLVIGLLVYFFYSRHHSEFAASHLLRSKDAGI